MSAATDKDFRLAGAERLLEDGTYDVNEALLALGMLHAYALERLRINVGVQNVNAQLLKRLGESAQHGEPDITQVTTADLLAEVERRMTR